MSHISAQQGRGKAGRSNKYGARKTVLDGITFDSAAEANRYALLTLRARAGEISDLERQPEYDIHGCAKYRADFRYRDHIRNAHVVEDVKGMDTPVSRLKRKLVKAIHGVDVEIVKA